MDNFINWLTGVCTQSIVSRINMDIVRVNKAKVHNKY